MQLCLNARVFRRIWHAGVCWAVRMCRGYDEHRVCMSLSGRPERHFGWMRCGWGPGRPMVKMTCRGVTVRAPGVVSSTHRRGSYPPIEE